jgi:hypothetical protein
VSTETAGVREIDTGALPDRFARGWHCLGPVEGYLDGNRTAWRSSAPCWWCSPTRRAN